MTFLATLLFWDFVFLFGFIIIAIFASEYDSIFGFVIGLLVTLAGLQFLGSVDVVHMISENPWKAGILAAAYLLIGGAYSMFVSWPEWLKERAPQIKSDYDSWAELQKKWNTHVQEKNVREVSFDKFIESDSYIRGWSAKSKANVITSMIATWVFDLLWKVIHKPVRWTYDFFAGAFSRIGDTITKKILQNG